jgi:enoyl-[acyl-carrier protein] reductase II
MYATMALGAEGVQVGSRFVCSPEASSHQHFKEAIVQANEGDTMLSLKRLTPVRLIKNRFYNLVAEAESRCASNEELVTLLGRARAKLGMFEGNLEEGELEIGQVSGLIKDIKPAAEIVRDLWSEFCDTMANPFYKVNKNQVL